MTQETQFLSLLRTASKSDLQVLAKLLSLYLAEAELRQTKVWGIVAVCIWMILRSR